MSLTLRYTGAWIQEAIGGTDLAIGWVVGLWAIVQIAISSLTHTGSESWSISEDKGIDIRK